MSVFRHCFLLFTDLQEKLSLDRLLLEIFYWLSPENLKIASTYQIVNFVTFISSSRQVYNAGIFWVESR